MAGDKLIVTDRGAPHLKQFGLGLAFLSLLIFSVPVYATGAPLWQANGVAVSSTASTLYQAGPQSVYVGGGETVIGWYESDLPAFSTFKLYAQKIDINGKPVWASPVYVGETRSSEDQQFCLVSAETGAAIFVWEKEKTNTDVDIYAQKVASNGSLAWGGGTAASPLAISTVNGDQRLLKAQPETRRIPVVNDGANLFIVWQDDRSGSGRVYGAVVDASSGTITAGAGGGKELLPTSEGYPAISQLEPVVVSDGTGDFVLAWQSSSGGAYDIFAQKFNSSLARQWPTATGGVTVCAAVYDQEVPQMVSDGSGGVVMVWEDMRDGSNWGLYGQRLDSSGSALWSTNGVRIAAADDFNGDAQLRPKLIRVTDGIIVAWDHVAESKIYASRLSISSGDIQWGPVNLVSGYNSAFLPEIVSGGSGKAIIVWSDLRRAPEVVLAAWGFTVLNKNLDIYAQKINLTTGALDWPAPGLPVANADYAQLVPFIASDGQGGAVVAFGDSRDASQKFISGGLEYNVPHIYAQRIGDTSAPTFYAIDQITFDGRDFVPGTDLYVDANPTLGARLISYYSPIDTAEVFGYVDAVPYDVDQANNYSVISPYEGRISGLKLLIAPGASPTIRIQFKDIDGNSREEAFEVRVETLESEVRIENQPVVVPPVAESGGTSIISYNLTASGDIDIFMFSPGGKITKTWHLASGVSGASAGYNEVAWDGRSDTGDLPGRGIYPIKIIRRADKKVIGKTYLVIGR